MSQINAEQLIKIKTSQRICGTLDETGNSDIWQMEFKDYYKVKTEKIIEHFKSKLEDE